MELIKEAFIYATILGVVGQLTVYFLKNSYMRKCKEVAIEAASLNRDIKLQMPKFDMNINKALMVNFWTVVLVVVLAIGYSVFYDSTLVQQKTTIMKLSTELDDCYQNAEKDILLKLKRDINE